MKKKGFTIVELLAVIVILGILSSLAIVGVTRYREEVKKKELVNLHSTIEAWYDSYQSNLLINGKSKELDLSLTEAIDAGLDIAYNGERITKETANGKLSLKVKGDLLSKSNYITGKTETDFIDDGTCIIKATKNGDVFDKSCVGTAPNYNKSKEEILCIKLIKVNETEEITLINDFEDETNLCHYWEE